MILGLNHGIQMLKRQKLVRLHKFGSRKPPTAMREKKGLMEGRGGWGGQSRKGEWDVGGEGREEQGRGKERREERNGWVWKEGAGQAMRWEGVGEDREGMGEGKAG